MDLNTLTTHGVLYNSNGLSIATHGIITRIFIFKKLIYEIQEVVEKISTGIAKFTLPIIKKLEFALPITQTYKFALKIQKTLPFDLSITKIFRFILPKEE